MAQQENKPKNKINPKVLAASAIGIVAIIAVIAIITTAPAAGLTTLPSENQGQNSGNTGNEQPTIGKIETFMDSGKEIELQDGKPVIRLFSTTWCPHCKWIKETFDRVAKEYADAGKIVAYHWEVDTKDNTLTPQAETSIPKTELAVFQEFNPQGYVPAFVFGGKYSRIGNGYEQKQDLAAEEAEFRAVIESLIAEAQE